MKVKEPEGHRFGCCSRFNECEYGHAPCPRYEAEPNYVAGCDCFKRYMKNQSQNRLVSSLTQVVEERVPDFMAFDEEGQGYLL